MRRYTLALGLVPALIILFASGTSAQGGRVSGLSVAQAASGPPVLHHVQVSSAVRHGVSPPLRDLRPSTSSPGKSYPARGLPVASSSSDAAGTAASPTSLPALSVTPGLSFAGVGNGDYG